MQPVDSLVRTKLHLPFTRPLLVVRPRLQQQVALGLRGPLTLITAPAGFGKTTLVVSSLAQSGLPTAWLSLDKDDNQPGRFLQYLLATLHEVDPAVGQEALALLAAARPAPPEQVLTHLINDLHRSAADLVLALDDYQLITLQEIHDQVAFLLEHCPRSLHVIIASRSDPPLPLARLRARGQTVELRAADLGFTEAEAAQFLNEVMGLALQPSAVALLQARTEGWIAGLQMAALSLRDHGDVARFVAGFSGTNRYILDYLLDEVMASQPPHIQRFLLYTSLLERLTAPLCDVILAADGPASPLHPATDCLDYLERANLFLVPLDDQRTWYRYHHLFADLLRAQLQRQLGAESVARLHLRASDWHAQNGSVLEAIEYASRAADEERVEHLIEQNYMDLLGRGEQSAMRYWSGKLSRERVYRRPWLCIFEAHSQAWYGQLDEAERLLDRASERIPLERDPAERAAMLGHQAYVRSRVAAMRGDMPRAIDYCLEARRNVPASNLSLQFNVNVTLGYEYFLLGDYANASRILTEAIHAGLASGAVIYTVASYCFIARAWAVQGRLHDAYDTYQTATRAFPTGAEEHRDAQALLKMGLADVLSEWNQLEAAQEQVQQALEWMQFWGKTDDWALAYLALARIRRALGDPDGARAAVMKAVEQVQSSGVFPEARQAVEAALVKLWLATGDNASADHWARPRESVLLAERLGFEHELANLALARVWLARGRANQAVTLLSRVEQEARCAGRMSRAIEALALLALARRQLGDPEAAQTTLSQCLALAEPQGYARLLLEEGEPMRSLLALWLARAPAGTRRAYVERILGQFEPRPAAAPPALPPVASGGDLLEPLSQREREVLGLMALGKTNREIARELVVAAGTVKAHTASIYRKLDVANRTQAAARARQLGLLP